MREGKGMPVNFHFLSIYWQTPSHTKDSTRHRIKFLSPPLPSVPSHPPHPSNTTTNPLSRRNVRRRGFLPPTHPPSRVSTRWRAFSSPTTLPHVKMWDRGASCHPPTLPIVFRRDGGLSLAPLPSLVPKRETEGFLPSTHPPSRVSTRWRAFSSPTTLLISIFII